jgi:hypothetical protein
MNLRTIILHTVLLTFSLLFAVPAMCQYGLEENKDAGYAYGVKVYNGKHFTSDEIEKINRGQDSANASYAGRMYMPFDLLDEAGKHICTASVMGKVTILAFREPTDTRHYEVLKDLAGRYNTNKDVQLVLVSFDTSGFKKTLTAQGLASLSYVRVREIGEAHEMNFGNSFPSFVVLNKHTIVSLVMGGRIGSNTNFAEEISRTVDKLLAIKD